MLVSRTFAALTSVVLLAPLAAAQDARVVKGSYGDLKGVTVVYVDAGADDALRELVTAQLREQLPELAVADAPVPGALVVRFARGYMERRDLGEDFGQDLSGMPSRSNGTFQPRVRGSMRSAGLPTSGEKVARNQTQSPDLTSRPRMLRETYALGWALVPSGAHALSEVVSFRRIAHRGFEGPAKDFVRKLAKEYRKANR